MPSFRATQLALLALCVAGATATPASAQTSPAPSITRAQFTSLRWLEGRWLGSGGAYAAFYEEYRFLNDSTIEQREFPDSTFASPSGVSTIEWRNGAVQKLRRGTAQSRLSRVAGDTARFDAMIAGRGGFTWIRLSATSWRAILDGASAPTVYNMRRFGGGR